MKSIKLTPSQYQRLGRKLPTRHVACQPRTPDYGVSQYSKETAYASIYQKIDRQLQRQP